MDTERGHAGGEGAADVMQSPAGDAGERVELVFLEVLKAGEGAAIFEKRGGERSERNDVRAIALHSGGWKCNGAVGYPFVFEAEDLIASLSGRDEQLHMAAICSHRLCGSPYPRQLVAGQKSLAGYPSG